MSTITSSSGASIGLELLDGEYAVCRFEPGGVPAFVANFTGIYSLTATHHETSVVCRVEQAPLGVPTECGWRALYVKGPIPFGLTGVVAGITSAVAGVGLPVFVLSTYDSDLLFLQEATLGDALNALTAGGYFIDVPDSSLCSER
ncbi:ACT domain-containing protein [Arthrobacter sp. Leaf141]|uniref:ACT domain-containing protein n=1 Tax=Arthrobacter sp. Leaf141 TaxID=1736273 RepID=UPI0009EA8DD3